MNLVAPFDDANAKVEPLVEDALIYLADKFHLVSETNLFSLL